MTHEFSETLETFEAKRLGSVQLRLIRKLDEDGNVVIDRTFVVEYREAGADLWKSVALVDDENDGVTRTDDGDCGVPSAAAVFSARKTIAQVTFAAVKGSLLVRAAHLKKRKKKKAANGQQGAEAK